AAWLAARSADQPFAAPPRAAVPPGGLTVEELADDPPHDVAQGEADERQLAAEHGEGLQHLPADQQRSEPHHGESLRRAWAQTDAGGGGGSRRPACARPTGEKNTPPPGT